MNRISVEARGAIRASGDRAAEFFTSLNRLSTRSTAEPQTAMTVQPEAPMTSKARVEEANIAVVSTQPLVEHGQVSQAQPAEKRHVNAFDYLLHTETRVKVESEAKNRFTGNVQRAPALPKWATAKP